MNVFYAQSYKLTSFFLCRAIDFSIHMVARSRWREGGRGEWGGGERVHEQTIVGGDTDRVRCGVQQYYCSIVLLYFVLRTRDTRTSCSVCCLFCRARVLLLSLVALLPSRPGSVRLAYLSLARRTRIRLWAYLSLVSLSVCLVSCLSLSICFFVFIFSLSCCCRCGFEISSVFVE